MDDPGRRITRVEALKRSISDHATYTLGRDRAGVTVRDVYMSTAWTVRDRLAERWAATGARHHRHDARRVYLLSAEYLVGRTLGNALLNLGLEPAVAEALEELGYGLEEIAENEPDAGLGSGAPAVVAASWLDAMAALEVPGYGYGIRYAHGSFRQAIDAAGRQVERPDNWLHDENPWEIVRPDRTYRVRFYGGVRTTTDEAGRPWFDWVDTRDVLATAFDVPVPGFRNNTVHTLRLWGARATEEFDLDDFARGDFLAAVGAKASSEALSSILHPPDDTAPGKELRLRQQYFLASAALQDIVRRYLGERRSFDDFAAKVHVHLADTNAALAVPELMRLLLDEHGLEWDAAWETVRRTFSYTPHAVLPEVLDAWGLELLGRVLPRHLQIVEEIDRRTGARAAARGPGDERPERTAIVTGGEVSLGRLACAASHAVVPLSEAHADAVRERLFPGFHALFPERFAPPAAGVSPRRWLLLANPGAAALITEAIGDGWAADFDEVAGLEPYAADAAFRERWRAVRSINRRRLARVVMEESGVRLDPAALMDVHATRIQEHRRQLLNALRVVDRYLELRDGAEADAVPRAVVFAGKAAPVDAGAKRVIRLVHAVAAAVNGDADVNRVLRVAFVPDHRPLLAERIVPGADLSEQISAAGYDAVGTGAMKMAMNGALMVGTRWGTVAEIAEAVGAESVFLFGPDAAEAARLQAEESSPRAAYERSPRLRRALDFVASGLLSPENPGLFRPLVEELLNDDAYGVLADFDAYLAAQAEVDLAFRDGERWTRASIRAVARSGPFSADRAVRRLAAGAWKVEAG